MRDEQGLYVKYHVTKMSDGTPVGDCFVLRPDKDPAARAAIQAYAWSITNRQLSGELLNWLLRLDSEAPIRDQNAVADLYELAKISPLVNNYMECHYAKSITLLQACAGMVLDLVNQNADQHNKLVRMSLDKTYDAISTKQIINVVLFCVEKGVITGDQGSVLLHNIMGGVNKHEG
ncbi:hypothetical protein D3C76_1092440 [compost metagenome]